MRNARGARGVTDRDIASYVTCVSGHGVAHLKVMGYCMSTVFEMFNLRHNK